MPPPDPIWAIEPHTLAKHQILLKYWQAWLPIMSSWNGRVLYVDGFAGPGEYVGGEPGSPVIAIDAAINHAARISAQVTFWFIEAERDRAEYLQSLLAEKRIPSNFQYQVFNSRFNEVMTEALDKLEEQRRRFAPAFVFVDPFGYSQTPFQVISRLLHNPKCEVLITFMYQFINRFVSDQTQWGHLDQLYGTSDWRAVLDVQNPAERRSIFQILTKRHERLQAVANQLDWAPNVWIGVSVENQYWADRRIPPLLTVPAAVRFLSVEPLLKPVNLGHYLDGIHWVVVGGESGPKARPIEQEWVQAIRDDCLATGVPFFFKQWGGRTSKACRPAPGSSPPGRTVRWRIGGTS